MATSSTNVTNEQRMILDELRDLKATLRSAPALNGGFDRLTNNIEHIKEKQEEQDDVIKELREERHEMRNLLGQIKVKLDVTEKKQDKVESNVFDPDNGLFARMKVIESKANNVEKLNAQTVSAFEKHSLQDETHFQSIKEKLDEIIDDQRPLIDASGKLEEAAGKDFDEIKSLVKHKKNFDKIYWLLITAIVGTVLKAIFDVFFHR